MNKIVITAMDAGSVVWELPGWLSDQLSFLPQEQQSAVKLALEAEVRNVVQGLIEAAKVGTSDGEVSGCGRYGTISVLLRKK